MEPRDLYEDDLTDERYPTPEQRDDVAHTERLDPDTSGEDDDTTLRPSTAKDPEPADG